MPRELSVALTTLTEETLGATAGVFRRVTPLVEPLSGNPQYMAQLFGIYKYLKVTCLEVTHMISNFGTFPILCTLCAIPYNDALVADPREGAETPQSTFRFCGPASGSSNITMSMTYPVEKILGNVFTTEKYWITVAQAASTTVVDTNEPATALLMNSTAGNFAFSLVSKYTWHFQFFELRSNQL
jgi:hypothetical protein